MKFLTNAECVDAIKGTRWAILILQSKGSQDDVPRDMLGKRFVGLVFENLPAPDSSQGLDTDIQTSFYADRDKCVIKAVKLALKEFG